MIQSDKEHASVTLLDGLLTICGAMLCVDANKWEQAMQEEYKSLMAKGTWELSPVSHNRRAIGCKWVFRAKGDATGHVMIYKAWLVAKEFAQVHEVNFYETFPPVAKFTDYTVHPCNRGNHGLRNPSNGCKENHVCKLKKSLHGLKQSPRTWYQKIDTFLVQNGFAEALLIIACIS